MEHPLSIGGIPLPHRVILSPMEGVSDVGFRQLCHRLGADLTWTEMVRASGIVRKNKATLDLIDTFDPETPTGLQLFAVNERELAVALYTLEQLASTSCPHFKNIIAIDLNFGCPSPEIIRIGAGPALLKRTNKMSVMFDKLAHWRKTTTLPIKAIGAKIRLGLNQMEQDHKVYLRLIDAANQHLDYLVVHARNAKQRSRDPPTWSAIREIKEKATIPIIGNGDVRTRTDMERMLAETGCDAVMVARAAIENPWSLRALAGIGPGNATPEEIAAAREAYAAIAKQHNPKEKYLAFHTANFARLTDGGEYRTPRSEHMN
jgi:tRNA-dihydrouridine synthase